MPPALRGRGPWRIKATGSPHTFPCNVLGSGKDDVGRVELGWDELCPQGKGGGEARWSVAGARGRGPHNPIFFASQAYSSAIPHLHARPARVSQKGAPFVASSAPLLNNKTHPANNPVTWVR